MSSSPSHPPHFLLYIYIILYIVSATVYLSQEVGKQSSELRMALPHEGWCEALHHITIHSMKGGVTLHHRTIHSMKGGVRLCITQQYTQWRVAWDFTSQNNTLNEGWCETVVWDLASRNNTLSEGWCETLHHVATHSMKGEVTLHHITIHSMKSGVTLHHITIHSMKGGVRLCITQQYTQWRVAWLYITEQYTQWRVVWDFASHNNTLNEGWRETLHHRTIHSMKGGVRLWFETWHHVTIHSAKGGVRLYIT